MLCLVFSVSGASLLATVCVLAKLRTIAKGEAPETLNTKHQTPIMPNPHPFPGRLPVMATKVVAL